VILAGVRALTIHDQKNVETRDLSAQFYLTEEDVGQNRAEACKDKLQELNNAVAVSASSAELSAEYLGQFQVRCCWRIATAATEPTTWPPSPLLATACTLSQ
jgi:ubiquitin-activating enzyme E1